MNKIAYPSSWNILQKAYKFSLSFSR
jgi:hypothetical protein